MIDYSIYDLLDEFQLHDAAALWAEIEYNEDIGKNPKFKALLFAMNMAINDRELLARTIKIREETHSKSSLARALDDYMGEIGREEPSYTIMVLIRRENLKSWADRKRQKPKFLFPEMRIPITSTETINQENQAEPATKDSNSLNPNKSSLLANLNQASFKFWANADKDDKSTWPNTNSIELWLVQNGFAPTLAKKGASIIRPEWAPSGRRPEEY